MAISKFLIMDRVDAVQYCQEQHKEKAALISINSCGQRPARITKTQENGVISVLRLFFDDVVIGQNSFDEDHAESIIRFVDAWRDSADVLLVHCDAGVSRSAAVCAAAKRYLGVDDMDVFRSTQYEPNHLVYTTIRKITAGETYTPEQDRERFLINDWLNN